MDENVLTEKKKKLEIISKYEQEAKEKNCEEWLSKGNSVRVPENKASHYFISRKIAEALKLVESNIASTTNVLEIGCSFGQMTTLLAEKFNNLTAVDISPTSVEVAEKRLLRYGISNVKFIIDDAEYLTHLPDKRFDIVFSFSTIRFCLSPERALRAIQLKLRPGGLAIIDFPNPFSPWHLFVKSIFGIKKHVHDNLYSKKQLIQLFSNCGFDVESTKVFLFTTKRLPSFALPFFKLIDMIFERLPIISNLGGIIMLKARVK